MPAPQTPLATPFFREHRHLACGTGWKPVLPNYGLGEGGVGGGSTGLWAPVARASCPSLNGLEARSTVLISLGEGAGAFRS